MNCRYCLNRYADLECHRHAPTPAVSGRGVWPTVERDDWCSEWRLAEEETP